MPSAWSGDWPGSHDVSQAHGPGLTGSAADRRLPIAIMRGFRGRDGVLAGPPPVAKSEVGLFSPTGG
jgi:hypothetical protein